MHVDEQRVLSFSRELWDAQLGLSVGPGTQATNNTGAERIWTSYIKVSGPWQGAILLECPESIVRHASVMLFATDGATAADEEFEDAVNELTEMLGKKMRSMLPETTKLSRPSVIGSNDENGTALAGMHGLATLTLDCEGRPIRIALFESAPVPTS